MTPIVIPLHKGGGKFGDDTEARLTLRSIERHFKGDYVVAIVAGKLPTWARDIELVKDGGKGLKTALLKAADRFPDGFFWWYDDCTLLKDQTPEELKVTLASKKWRNAKTSWARSLERIKVRLEKEGHKAWDYSRPHGPYWFTKAMVDEAFADWPKMKGKFPFESWILSKHDWPRRHGNYKQYYGKFKNPPAESAVLVNYNGKGFSNELQNWLEERFPSVSKYEQPLTLLDGPLAVSVLDLANRPRYGRRLVDVMSRRGFSAEVVYGVEGAPTWLRVNRGAFKREYKRAPLKGEFGCYASHQLLMRKIISGELPQFVGGWWVILEDDAVPSKAMDPEALRRVLSNVRGFDFIMLHPGRKGHRHKSKPRVSPVTWNKYGREFGTFAYAVTEKGAAEIAKFIMRHPIDHAILASRRVRVGTLWGEANFTHPAAAPGVPAIHWERGGVTVRQQQGVVRKIHQVWAQGADKLPEEFERNREEWRVALPGFELVLWDDESARKRWPDYAKVSDRCYHHATRADLILARAVRDIGGLATGTDCRPNNVGKLRELLDVLDTLVVITPGREELSNGLQWSARAGHPFWECVCKHQLRDGGMHLSRKSVGTATGPRCYMEAFNSHKWKLHVVTAPEAFTKDWAGKWRNSKALIDPGFKASWTKR